MARGVHPLANFVFTVPGHSKANIPNKVERKLITPMSRFLPKFILIFVLALAACESAEERAERYYQSGLALLEQGDVERALIEFRNVFVANPRHEDARMAYAAAQRDRGFIGDAYGQYVRVVEQNPENTDALIALAQIAVISSSWDEAESYGRRAVALAPQDDRAIIANAMLDYRDAVLAEESTDAAAAVATQALSRAPASVIARKVVIDHAIANGDISAALVAVEDGLAIDPAQPDLHVLRVGLYGNGDDPAKTQTALEDMATQFPDNPQVQKELVGWYVSQEDFPAAEAYLRKLATGPDATQAQTMAVVDFLRQTRGIDVAQQELERLIASSDDNSQYRALRATIMFARGGQDEAVAEMEEIIALPENADNAQDFKVVLAQMFQAQSKTEDAKSLVAAVLEEDAGHIDALKMQAQWSIQADDPDGAIILLRQALAQEPRDVDLITLLGSAHERAGDHDLAGDRYALAVEISRQGVAPSLRHARFLLGRDWLESAEAVVTSALALAPRDLDLLSTLADIQLRQGAWNNVTRIIWRLRAMDTAASNDLAARTELALLNRQERFDETRVFLEQMIADGATTMAAKAQLVEAQIRAGRLDDARAFLKEQLEQSPDDATLQFLQADLFVLTDDAAAGEAGYRALLQAYPANEHVLGRLYGMLANQNRQSEADAVVEEVLAKAPDAPMANMVKASRLENTGDFEGAIAIYEKLYATNSNNPIIANNLASMITAQRDDAESLDQAYAIAARLRGTKVPQFQDTIGWISYRRGNYTEALTYLEPAAKGLPNDALTHYHLGKTYVALEMPEKARTALERAIEVGEGRGLPQLTDAAALLLDLEN